MGSWRNIRHKNPAHEHEKKLNCRVATNCTAKISRLFALQAMFAAPGYISGHLGNRPNQFFHMFQTERNQ
jgi:hypothetical protein